MPILYGLSILAVLLGEAGAQGATRNWDNPCCAAISKVLPGKVITRLSNATGYQNEKNSYWTLSESVIDPGCFVQPSNAEDVAEAVKILGSETWKIEQRCKFAIRSGGHGTWSGIANQPGGVTIDLSNLKEVTISKDKTTVRIGPGNRWADVYEKLSGHGLGVSGGRWGNVGVGGLLTGGGISWYQGTKGLGCDGVVNHQVVLANGSIVNANAKENADLHRALKGGNNNFGIVTRFEMQAYQVEKIWGGLAVAKLPKKDAYKWWARFSNSSTMDPHSMALLMFQNIGDSVLIAGEVAYTKPISNPEIFEPVVKSALKLSGPLAPVILGLSPLVSGFLSSVPALSDLARLMPEGIDPLNGKLAGITDYYTFAKLNAITTGGHGMPVQFVAFSYVNSAEYMEKLLELHDAHLKKLTFIGFSLLSFQPVWHTSRTQAANAGGGNVMGFDDVNPGHDIVLVGMVIAQPIPNSDRAVREWVTRFISAAHALARQMGVYSPYVYTNYAAGFQDVIAGYGETSKAFLKGVSAKYDPAQVFQQRVPGGYKLDGPQI